ncbi:hypothetical protein QSU92_10945 [Microbacterium sp. ET2]|uniref:hypothetical protein n=1 Tax=Microbacterium albipurpureum TaxID=3050384 RepID=UPI00259D2296|nr:hypothetical protein [Microbacterium sp. ET2 (Ac-2212)]WJL94489.1 hypothetical protein QSU92_10945 [Microbacterium sp. ET2 (Ac-2212)]
MSQGLASLPRIVFGSATAAQTVLATQDAAIRAPLSTTRRIGFLSLSPHESITHLALQVTRAVTARRPESVLTVDVTPDGGLARALEVAETAPNETRAGARTTAEALTGLEDRRGIVGLRPPAAGDPVGAWLAEAAPITRFFEVAVTDFGAHHPLADLGSCAALSDVVCLVADATRLAAENARAVVPAIQALPEAPAVVLALTDTDPDSSAVARAIAMTSSHPVVFIPRAPRAARRAVLSLAASLVAGGREVSA